jgi:hypothetical protein
VTLLSAVQNVAGEAGYTVDTRVLASTDITTTKLGKLAQRVLEEMAIASPWTNFYASGSITLADGVAAYALPDAFDYQIYDTFWNSSTRWRLLGPITEREYAEIQGYGLNAAIYKRYQFRGISDKKLTLTPTPTSSEDGQTVVFEYIAARYVRPQTWAAATVFAAGAYCFVDGRYYQTTAGGSGGSQPVHTSGTTGLWTYYDGAYTTFLADTDESILPQRVMELGMLERFDERHDLAGASRYDEQLSREIAKDKPGRIFYAGGESARFVQARSGVAVFGTWI